MSDGIKRTTIAEELNCGKTVTLFTVGVSMQPLLAERQTHVTVIPAESIHKGDILLYIRADGDYVLHRLIKTDKDHFYIRGDNTYGLELVDRQQIIGRVTHIYRNKKIIDIETSNGYRLYVFVWNFLYPCRWLLWKLRLYLRRLCKKIAAWQKEIFHKE